MGSLQNSQKSKDVESSGDRKSSQKRKSAGQLSQGRDIAFDRKPSPSQGKTKSKWQQLSPNFDDTDAIDHGMRSNMKRKSPILNHDLQGAINGTPDSTPKFRKNS